MIEGPADRSAGILGGDAQGALPPSAIRVDYPSLHRLTRADPASCTVGDEAEVVAEHTLVDLVERLVPRSDAVDSPCLPRYAVPIGLAVTAGSHVTEAIERDGVLWVTRSIANDWHHLPAPGEPIVSRARLIAIDHRHADLEVEGRVGSGELVHRGLLRLVPTRAARYVHHSGSLRERFAARRPHVSGGPSAATAPAPAAPLRAPLFDIRRSIVERTADGVRATIFPDCMRFLCSPVAGHGEPVGRRSHPVGTCAFTAAIATARALVAEEAGRESRDVVRTRFVIRAAWSLDDVLHATARRAAPAADDGVDTRRVAVDVARRDGVTVVTASLRFGRADVA